MGTFDIFGIYVASLLGYAAAALVLTLLLTRLLRGVGAYRFVWHAALFNTALFVIVLAAIALPGGLQGWVR